jgi:competence protein ComEC
MKYFIWLLPLLLIIFRYVTTQPKYASGQRIRISDTVTSEPIRYSDSQRIVLAGLRFYLPLYPEVNYGDKLVVEGVVQDSELKEPVLVGLRESGAILAKLRKRLISFYQGSLPEPHSSLVAGVTLGSKASIPQKFWEALKKTGTAHVVVASGMNVTLVAGFLMNFLVLFLRRPKAVVFALIGIWIYALMSGFDAPIIRAAIMGSVAFSAQGLGKLYSAWRGLFLSVAGMLIVNPNWITDLGFILSFVATASLMLFARRVDNKIKFLPSLFREGLSTSLAAQVGVAPILFVTFGQFSILSPIVNALVLWTIAPITIIGMIAAILSLVSIWLGKLVLLLCYPLTIWFVEVAKLFG